MNANTNKSGVPPPPFGMPGLPQGMIPRTSPPIPDYTLFKTAELTNILAPNGRGMPLPPFPGGPPMPGGLPFPPPNGLPFPPPGGLPPNFQFPPPPGGFPIPPQGFPAPPGQFGQDQGGDRR
jgi:U1 small nuclear ribonucleoprotein C